MRWPSVEVPDDASSLLDGGPTGFGDGDVADVDDEPASDEGSAGRRGRQRRTLAEVDRLRELAMRQQADFENFRKRASNQQALEVERATGRLAQALLPVLDAAEAAYVQHPDEIGPLLNQMIGELKKVGLEPLDLTDQPFDPELAEAVAHQPGDGGEVVVAEVLRSGYQWQGKTLRPAMVRTTD
ncbi:MAG: nucleotide exchange factor GrpE [Ilumatobacteraceae bacterium]